MGFGDFISDTVGKAADVVKGGVKGFAGGGVAGAALGATASIFDTDKAKKTGDQVAKNPLEIAKIACQMVGLPQAAAKFVLIYAEAVAPKNEKGEPQLTEKAILATAQMVASTTQTQNKKQSSSDSKDSTTGVLKTVGKVGEFGKVAKDVGGIIGGLIA